MNKTPNYNLPLYNRDDLFSVDHYNDGMVQLDESMKQIHDEKMEVSPIMDSDLGNSIEYTFIGAELYMSIATMITSKLATRYMANFRLLINTPMTDKPKTASDFLDIIVTGLSDLSSENEDGTTSITSGLFLVRCTDLASGDIWKALYTKATNQLSIWKRVNDLEDQKKDQLQICFTEVLYGTSVDLLTFIIDKCKAYNHFSFVFNETIDGVEIIWNMSVNLVQISVTNGNRFIVSKSRIDAPYTVLTNTYLQNTEMYENIEWHQLYPIDVPTPPEPVIAPMDWEYTELDMTDAGEVVLSPYTYYKIINVSDFIEINLLVPDNTTRVLHYRFELVFGEEVPVFTIGENLVWLPGSPSMENPNKTYIIDICNGYANAVEV